MSVYQASLLKRSRATQDEMRQFREDLYEIVDEMKPMTVRQVFYQATVKGIVEKSENGYVKVQTNLVRMRKDGDLPYDWLVDHTRARRRPYTHDNIQEALEDTARLYRKALWAKIDAYVEVWIEKDALTGVVEPVTDAHDVSLMSARGYASLSFLSEAAEYIRDLNVPVYIYHLGDFDPSGVNAGEKIEEGLRELAPDADIHFERLAVNEAQILEWNLPTRPTKSSDTRSRNFGEISVELDAIRPDDLRDLVQKAIERHLPPEEFKVLKVAEKSERRLIRGLVAMVEDQGLELDVDPDDPDNEDGEEG
jgi:hypothetical protein